MIYPITVVFVLGIIFFAIAIVRVEELDIMW